MAFRDGKMYTVTRLDKTSRHWPGVTAAVRGKAKSSAGKYVLKELYEVRWRTKPFPWPYWRFKKEKRWFWHGTTVAAIQKILGEGFRVVSPRTGRLLGNGVYLTYHTNKGFMHGERGYVVSTMVYAPNLLAIGPGETLSRAAIAAASRRFHGIEVRTAAEVEPKWDGLAMANHEICVYDCRRVQPRFICGILRS